MTAQPGPSDWYADFSIKRGLMAEPVPQAQHRDRHQAVIAALCLTFAFLFGTAAIAGHLQANPSHRPHTPTALAAAPRQRIPDAPSSAPATAPAYRLMSWSGSYFKTSWGVSCEVASDHVTCQSCIPGQVITNAYTCSDPAPGVAVSAAGIVDHNAGTIASSPDSQLLANGQTYHANGWTIVASGGWARFINDATGHGMAVAPQNFDSF